VAHVLPPEPITDLGGYEAWRDSAAMTEAHRLGPDGVIAEIRRSGLRGRGGAGFPTGVKWAGLAASGAATRFVACNAAEGEPGTFKDRMILRRNPHQVVEGLAVAAFATGADRAFLCIKEKFFVEARRVEAAALELSEADRLGGIEVVVVEGPDDYLFGEEKGMLEVIEGRDPLPRLYPPYVQGLFEERGGPAQPVVVNNVETLANVPAILERGAEWHRGIGTEQSPGTVVCTIGGDVEVEGVAEIELGTPLRTVIEQVGGGVRAGGRAAITLNGVSNAPLREAELDAALSMEGMRAVGSGIGSAGFTVFDETMCPLRVVVAASAFLYRGSCGQCPSCKLGTEAITSRLAAIVMGRGDLTDLEEVSAWTLRVTDANRCGLGAGERALVAGFVERYADEIAAHAVGAGCGRQRAAYVPSIVDYDEDTARFTYAQPVLEDAPGS
jgi:NADH-quinone oxidoreductase subunit F